MGRNPLSTAIRDWIQRAIDLGCDAPIEEALRHLTACPGAFTTSPDHAYYAGLLIGRLIEIDRAGTASVDDDCLDRAFAVIEPYTVFPPATAVYALAGLDPRCLLALIATWPREHDGRRPFYLGVMLGILTENPAIRQAIGAPAVDELFDMLEGSRRPDAGDTLARDGDPLSLI